MSKHRYTKEEITEWQMKNGIFYFNRDDSNFMIPKTYGIGWTFNWAHPLSWVAGAAIIALLIWAIFFKRTHA